MQFRKKTAILLLLFIGLLTYGGTVQNNFILGDDEDQIVNQAQVHSLENIPQFFLGSTYYSKERDESYGLFYRPIMLATYSLLYAAVGPDPAIFHLFQLALHITNSIIILLLMSLFFPLIASFLIALIFLVHPMNSETVLLSSNLQDVLFFYFGSLSLLILAINRGKQLGLIEIYAFSMCLLLSLFSKETGLLFGFIAIVYAFLFSKKNIVRVVIPVVLAAVCLIIFRFFIAKIGFGISIFSPIAHASFAERMLNMPSIFVRYIDTFVYPASLQSAQFWLESKVTLFGFIIPLIEVLVFLLLVAVAAFYIRRKDKKLFLIYVFFMSWFFAGMLLHLHIIPLEITVALRWFYAPIIGLLGMITVVYFAFVHEHKRFQKIVIIICLIIVLLLSIRTYIRVGDWRDSMTLFTHELKTAGDNYILENSLATLYIRNGEYGKALPLVKKSVSTYEYFANVNNMALLYAHQKNFKKADEYFSKAIRMNGNFMVYQNYANYLLYYKKDFKKAIEIADIGIQRYPNGSFLYTIRAQAEYNLGNYRKALSDAQTAEKLTPSAWTKEVYDAIKEKRKIQTEKFFKAN
jgi:tetratricopeptide (TPR) repeat protein